MTTLTAEFQTANPLRSDRRTPLRWVLSHLGRHKILIAIMLIGAFGNASLAAVIPSAVGQAVRLAEQADLRGIGLMAGLVVLSQAVRAILQFGRNFSAELLGQRLERDTREELYTSLLGKSMTFHVLQPVGDTMARATNDVREMNMMISLGLNLVIGSFNFILMPLLLAPSYHPHLLLAPLFFTVTYFLSLVRYLRRLRPIADQVRQTFGVLNSRLAEALDGIEMVKGVAQEEQEIGRFVTNANACRRAIVAQGRIEARFLPLLLLGITVALAFSHALLLFNQGLLDLGAVVGYTGTVTLLGFPTFISLLAYSQVARGMAGARRILALIETETALDENRGGYSGTMRGEICFERVSAGYREGSDVLHDITFSVQPGKTVALVGQTGAGKSSIGRLINRIQDVSHGRVLVDGVDVRDWNLATLRRQISIIEQDIFLFSRTIAENIAFGAPGATREAIIAAAEAAQAHDFISDFPDGYETVVGERGVTLSGGQRQRIALARAFLTRPRILILDDSTSAVDSATEDKIQKAIANAASRQTTILITHRLSQIRWADQVVLLRQGRIAAVGDHDDLMQAYPAYRKIFGEQADA
jgi:ATP-binding cassette subfamily B protein